MKPKLPEVMVHPKGPIDFAIVTALPIERDAVLRRLNTYRAIQDDHDSLTYYHGHINISGQKECYEVVVVMQSEMGNIDAAIVTTKLIQRWQPKHLLMVGIAGGVREKVALGDIVVAKFCHYYESMKIHSDGEQRRPQQFHSSKLLYGRALAYNSNQWHNSINVPVPETSLQESYLPKVHFGPVGGGEKVIANEEALSKLIHECPQLLAVAMECAGVAQASASHGDNINFIEIRGICDFADEQKNDVWHSFAANAVAAYTIGLLQSGPVLPLSQSIPQSETFRNNNLPNLTSMIRKSIGWFALTFIVGLLQIWVTLIIGYLKGTPVLEDLIWDGVIPFFSIVLTSSLVIDHNLFGKTPMVIESGPFANPSDFVNGLMFSFIPWIVIIIPCLAIYVTCYVAKPEKIIPVVIMEVLLLGFTACYAVFIKFFHFREEERNQKETQRMAAELRKQKEQEEKPKQAQGKKSKPMSTQQLQLKGLQ